MMDARFIRFFICLYSKWLDPGTEILTEFIRITILTDVLQVRRSVRSVHPHVFHSFVAGEAPPFSSSFLCRWTRFDGFLPALAFACPGTHADSHTDIPCCHSDASSVLGVFWFMVEACEVRCLQYQTVSDLVRYCDDRGLWTSRGVPGCGCGVHCGVSTISW